MRLLEIILLVICLNQVSLAQVQSSVCVGETHDGSIVDAVQLPKTGENYVVFSPLAWHLGRTYVHSKVKQAIDASYATLAKHLPDHVFVYGETGWRDGGSLKPHKTHQNGLSVDFMVPVKDNNQPSLMPMDFTNRWGYDLEFNGDGKYRHLEIDFSAMAKHLKLLHQSIESQGYSIQRVFFDPELQPLLFAARDGESLKDTIRFNTKQAWVRHDEHYHVDFNIPCQTKK